ncbi:MAG TPA: carbohydrate porin [Thermodesulfobacteriota bacterium]|nr:carbohydrate porin [Thermodesulfobacteriota bacterium]
MAFISDRLTLLLLIALFILSIVPRPTIAGLQADEVADRSLSGEQADDLHNGNELSWISKLSSQLPKSAYELTDQWIPKVLGVQPPSWTPKLLGFQFTGVYQNMPSFHSPYEGQKSLTFDHAAGQRFTHTYAAYFGSQITDHLQLYADFEMFQGNGISSGVGLGGYVNGDMIRASPVNLGKQPYLARLYLRYVIPLSSERTEPAEPAMDRLPSRDPASRIEIKFGRFAPTDDIDQNRYANNQRTQFLNYSFLFNPAWDYASDTRGYSQGMSVSLVQPNWKLTFGSWQLPKISNGMNLDWQIYKDRGDNLEFSLKPNKLGTVVRLLAYRNEGRMGKYRDALDIAQLTNTTPDVFVLNKEPGHVKYGFGINLEQPLADNGKTGLFIRAGWADGRTTAWSYTEADQHLSIGARLSGVHWGRPEDHIGIGYGLQDISNLHKKYLEEGGIGMLVGDGALRYGVEQIVEAYYRIQLGKYIQVSPDFQYIRNPGYNRDRGPAQVYGVRFRLIY